MYKEAREEAVVSTLKEDDKGNIMIAIGERERKALVIALQRFGTIRLIF